MRAYIYALDSSFCRVNSNTNENYIHELHIENAVRRTFMVTSDPSRADVFILPACPAVHLSSVGWDASITRMYDDYLMMSMRKIGPYVDAYPQRHIVPRMRCPTIPDLIETDEVLEAERGLTRRRLLDDQLRLFPRLWNASIKFSFFCFETCSLLGRSGVRIDRARELHVPYFLDRQWTRPKRGTSGIRFVGSDCCNRSVFLTRLRPENIRRNMHHGGIVNHQTQDDAFVRDASMMYMPPGDTPERRAIYQAFAVGTPVYFTSHVTPPLGLPDWGGWAYTDTNLDTALRSVPWLPLGRARNYFNWNHSLFLNRFAHQVAKIARA